VGLFGTVLGIIRAFKDLSGEHGGSKLCRHGRQSPRALLVATAVAIVVGDSVLWSRSTWLKGKVNAHR
jgi:biopolymer transport protein ExbB/TolQ